MYRLFLVVASRGYSSWQCSASHCGGFSCEAEALGMRTPAVVAHRLSSCGSWGPRVWASVVAEAGSVVMVHGHIGFGKFAPKDSYAGNLL